MRFGIGVKVTMSSILILLVYIVSSYLVMMGVLGLRDAMDESIEKSEQMNMLFRYNVLSSRLTLQAKDIIIDQRKVQSSALLSEFESLKSEIKSLMDDFLDMQKTSEDRSAAIRILGGSTALLDLIENSLILPLKNKENINFELINDALNGREVILEEIDSQLEKLETEKLQSVLHGKQVSSEVFTKSILSIGIAIFLVIITSSLLRKIIVSPVKKASAMLKDISEGEGDLTRYLSVESHDEVGELSLHFNIFLDRLKGIIRNIKDGSDHNLNLEKKLNESSGETLKSVSLIKETIGNISGKIELLNKDIFNSSSAVNQVSRSLTSLNNQASEQLAMAEESSAAVNEMIASIESVAMITLKKKESTEILINNADKGGEMLSDTIQAVEDINENIDSIMALTDIISGIASQTNLLSMNAAIEAAHAGDAGKGFAVVSDEIRKLAETTAINSTEIAKVLQTVIGRVKAAVDMSSKTKNAFDEIDKEVHSVTMALDEINSSTEELRSGGKEILDAMTALRDSSMGVKTAVNEIDKGSGEVNQAMNSIMAIAEDVVNEISGISDSSEKISHAVSGVDSISEQLSLTASTMAEEVNKFKI
jgi:methyl-accepting chemotaxis protein